MSGLQITLLVLVLLLLLAQLRIGAVVEYAQTGLGVRLKIGPLRIQLLPAKRAEKEKQPQKPKKKAEKPEKQRAKGGLLELVLEFLPLVLDTVKKFRRKLQVDTLDMELTVAAPDPADTAVRYGQANALMACLWQPMVETFHVKDGHAHIGMDFNATGPTLYLLASLSLTIGQTVVLAVVFGVKALGILIRTRSKNKKAQQPTQRKAVNYGTQSPHQ